MITTVYMGFRTKASAKWVSFLSPWIPAGLVQNILMTTAGTDVHTHTHTPTHTHDNDFGWGNGVRTIYNHYQVSVPFVYLVSDNFHSKTVGSLGDFPDIWRGWQGSVSVVHVVQSIAISFHYTQITIKSHTSQSIQTPLVCPFYFGFFFLVLVFVELLTTSARWTLFRYSWNNYTLSGTLHELTTAQKAGSLLLSRHWN